MNPKRITLFGTVWGCLMLAGLAVQAAEVSVSTTIGNLKSADEAVRLQAIAELGEQGEKAAEAVAPLADLLKDASATIRAHAARSLGEIGEPAKAAVPALAELVKDSDETVRRQAVRAIVRTRPAPKVLVPLLIKMLDDGDPGVRMRILNAIADRAESAVPDLIVALKNDKAAYWACLVLREIGPAGKDAVPALIERLKDKRPEMRREVMLTLAAMDDAAILAVGPIAATLDDKATCSAATYALARIGKIPVEAKARIKANAKSDDKTLSTTSLWALASVHPEDKQLRRETTEQLIERLKDKDAFVRVAAARAMAALPPAPEITAPIWEKAFQDADETTVMHALDSWGQLGAPAVPRLIGALKYENACGNAAHVLGRLGPAAAPATEALAKLVSGEDEDVALEAVLALGNIGPGAKAAVPALVKAIDDPENTNAAAIAYALGKIGPDAAEAEPTLSNLLKSPDKKLALASAWALVNIRPGAAEVAQKTLPLLMADLTDDVPLVRQGAAEALGSLGALAMDALPALQKTTSDADKAVGQAATEAIKQIRGGEAKQK